MGPKLKRLFVRSAFVVAVTVMGSVPIVAHVVPATAQAAHSALADGCSGGPTPCMRGGL